MKFKQVFDRMIQMEIASADHPNLMQTYEVMWNALKKEIQFGKVG